MRYVDDFALFGGSKRELWSWKQAIVDRLARLRLTVHAGAAQVTPVAITKIIQIMMNFFMV